MIGFLFGVVVGAGVVSFFPTLGATIEGYILTGVQKVTALVAKVI